MLLVWVFSGEGWVVLWLLKILLHRIIPGINLKTIYFSIFCVVVLVIFLTLYSLKNCELGISKRATS